MIATNRVEASSLPLTTARHLANELFAAIRANEWKGYYRSWSDPGRFRVAGGGSIPKGYKAEAEPPLELVGRGIATLALPDHALGIHEAFAIYLAEQAFHWALDDMQKRGQWHGFMAALSSGARKVWYRKQPIPQVGVHRPWMLRNPSITEAAGDASVLLLDYAEVHQLHTEATDAFLDSLPVPHVSP